MHLIAPIESQADGVKAVMVRLNDAEALVIESRRRLGFDNISEWDEGALVYRVNVANHDSAQEALIITNTNWPRNFKFSYNFWRSNLFRLPCSQLARPVATGSILSDPRPWAPS